MNWSKTSRRLRSARRCDTVSVKCNRRGVNHWSQVWTCWLNWAKVEGAQSLGRVWPVLFLDFKEKWHGLGLLCPCLPKWPSGLLGAADGTAERRSGRTGPGGSTFSSSCGGRELLLAGGPERCGAAGSERRAHLFKECRHKSVWTRKGVQIIQ